MCYIISTQQETHTFEFGEVMNRDIVLFDMDGTLTEARKPFASFLSSPLWKLCSRAEVGVVSGSDIDYIREQLKSLIDNHSIRYSLHLLPCNGTKWFIPPENASDSHQSVHSVSMEEHVGKANYRKIMEILIEQQHLAADLDMPLTGHFISARGSMINWCPIGRSADDKQRKLFAKFDDMYTFRRTRMKQLEREFKKLDVEITVKLGGDTSFDIYPKGWDKTYALRHFGDKNVWFVGDRALNPSGNDFEIFKACEPRSFHTTGPEQTVEVIEEIYQKIGDNNGCR